MNRDQLRKQIKKDGKENDIVAGALGELAGCIAWRESERITANGWETKYYGIKIPYKGKIDTIIIDKATITKRAFREILKLIPLKIKDIMKAMASIYACGWGESGRGEGLKSVELKMREFCPACRELVRSGIKAGAESSKDEKTITDLSYCFGMFLQFSPSYRLRAQEILGELDKDNFLKHPLTEILRLKRIFMSREIGERKKVEFLWWAIFLFVLLKKRLSLKFIKELNLEKIRLDEADWYYACRRSSYNFGGKDLYTRLVEAEQIDQRDGNIILELEKGKVLV